jgi:hypothetical protein
MTHDSCHTYMILFSCCLSHERTNSPWIGNAVQKQRSNNAMQCGAEAPAQGHRARPVAGGPGHGQLGTTPTSSAKQTTILEWIMQRR